MHRGTHARVVVPTTRPGYLPSWLPRCISAPASHIVIWKRERLLCGPAIEADDGATVAETEKSPIEFGGLVSLVMMISTCHHLRSPPRAMYRSKSLSHRCCRKPHRCIYLRRSRSKRSRRFRSWDHNRAAWSPRFHLSLPSERSVHRQVGINLSNRRATIAAPIKCANAIEHRSRNHERAARVRESLDRAAFQTAHAPYAGGYVASSSSSALASLRSAVSKPSVNQP